MDFGLSEAIFSDLLGTKVVLVDDVNNFNVGGAFSHAQPIDNCAILFSEIYKKHGMDMEKKVEICKKITNYKQLKEAYSKENDILFVKTITNKTFTVPFQRDCTVRELKEMIQEIKDIPISWQSLIYDNILLNDKNTLDWYGIKPDSYVYLTMKLRGGINSLEVKTYSGETLNFGFNSQSKVIDLKRFIHQEKDIPVDRQIILFHDNELTNNEKAIDQIVNGSTAGDRIVYLFLKETDGTPRILGKQILSPAYNYDFTGINDSGRTFMRGGKEYKRPCGWKRMALNVENKYDNNIWLGSSNASDEWPVAYHGTNFNGIHSIAFNGFDISRFQRGIYGRGHYTTPDIAIAEGYARYIHYGEKKYKYVLQCRVSPTNMQIHHNGQYWLLPNDQDLRPYGICIKDA